MKFECKECDRGGCVLEIEKFSEPHNCPRFDSAYPKWREVPEPSALPKLTVEALAERGIEWPELATCAMTCKSGNSFFCKIEPEIYKENFWHCYEISIPIPGKWDATDWQNSKIMRPEKVVEPKPSKISGMGWLSEAAIKKMNSDWIENKNTGKAKPEPDEKPQLPDWVKPGVWAYNIAWGLCKVTSIESHQKYPWIQCEYITGGTGGHTIDHFKPVTWRSWSDSEMKEQVGKIFKSKSTGHRLLVTECGCGRDEIRTYLYMGNSASLGKYAEEVLREREQLNGLPCGIPQVNGKDIKV